LPHTALGWLWFLTCSRCIQRNYNQAHHQHFLYHPLKFT
jgi:hypothetical protein